MKNTIPFQHSREVSRYEPPVPVKEKEKEDLLEKVREITSGESKGSKDEKQVEGETELSWDHEELEPYPSPERPKPQREPKERGIPKENVKSSETQSRGPKSEEDQEEGKGPLRRAKEKLVLPKQEGITPKELGKDTEAKRDHPKEGNKVDKNTEQWVNDQNKFWENKRESLEETIPKVFEPQSPIRILQRVNNHNQGYQNKHLSKQGLIGIFGTVVMMGPIIKMGTRWDILVKIGIGNKGMDMVEGMAMGIKTSKEGPIGGPLLKLKHNTSPQREGFPIKTHHPKE